MTETLTHEDEAVEASSTAYADAIALIETTMRDISGTSITNSGAMVDVLLDIRNYIDEIVSSSAN